MEQGKTNLTFDSVEHITTRIGVEPLTLLRSIPGQGWPPKFLREIPTRLDISDEIER
jgi:hypothetical protein